ncbi:MAG: isochorismatase family protein, partial [Actinomycetales bacterium]|nr:isochorismatase family protein [Actinomycetales bacterium]
VPNTFESNPQLAGQLRDLGVTEITMIGCQSEMCVRATAYGAKEAGFAVTVPAGLHGTYDSDGKTADQIKAEVDSELAATL